MIPDAMLQEMKNLYSIFIAENVKDDERREEYFGLINSIPYDLFNSKNPITIKKNSIKLSCFLFSINKELKEDGFDLTKLEKDMKEMTERYKKAITRGMI